MSVEFGSSINTLPARQVDIVSLSTLHVTRTKHHTLVNFIPEHYTPHRPLMRLTYGPERIVSARTFDETRTDIDDRQALHACIADRGGVYPGNEREIARLLRQVEMQFITPTILVDFQHAHAYIYSSNDEHPFKTFPIQMLSPLSMMAQHLYINRSSILG